MTSDWNSSAVYETGHHRSHVTSSNRGLLPPAWKLTYLRFQPIQTKFSHMTFDWNRSAEFENGYHRSNVTPPNRGIFFFFCLFLDVTIITLERLNQSKPNFHTWLLTGVAQPSSNMVITGNMQFPLIGGFCPHPGNKHTSDFNQTKPNSDTWLLTGIAHPSSKMGITGQI